MTYSSSKIHIDIFPIGVEIQRMNPDVPAQENITGTTYPYTTVTVNLRSLLSHAARCGDVKLVSIYRT